jgi:hypothetical protein
VYHVGWYVCPDGTFTDSTGSGPFTWTSNGTTVGSTYTFNYFAHRTFVGVKAKNGWCQRAAPCDWTDGINSGVWWMKAGFHLPT